MLFPEKWIWLDSNIYPDFQHCRVSPMQSRKDETYAVAEFMKNYLFSEEISTIRLHVSGDTAFDLSVNGETVLTGPVPVGGDFLGNDMPRSKHYATDISLSPAGRSLSFFARVKLSPVGIYEYSKGHGGFMLSCLITFTDGTEKIITTDGSWLARLNGAYTAPFTFDGTVRPDEWTNAQVVADIWHPEVSPLMPLDEEIITPAFDTFCVDAHETEEFTVEYDRIYAAIIGLKVRTTGIVSIELTSYETECDHRAKTETFVFDSDCDYRGLQIHSAGALKIRIENKSDNDVTVTPVLIAVSYPVTVHAETLTSDEELNNVLDVCAHTLRYCRQHIHLDSPCHCEPLACTGDYYIESLMTAFSYGDMTLAEEDIIRTAELIRNNGGRMFHTTYSLIWVMMLRDVYMFTGNRNMLKKCHDALIMLLDLFETYIGENGIIDNPPDYMFIDWLYIDEISLHHPPKALGQTCLNMFYYGALTNASEIFGILGDEGMKKYTAEKAEKLKKAVKLQLYDEDRKMFFEGLNTQSPEEKLYHYLPQNTDKRYYRKHANILACYVGLCNKDEAVKLLERIMSDEIEGDYQPYFAHYLLEAVYRNGLRDKYTLQIIEKWKQPCNDCRKGLAEGFIVPEPEYSFDHSHAWGGTPLYSLPLALSGLEIVKPGFEEIILRPSSLGLDNSRVQIPTPCGMIEINQQKGGKTEISVPEGIKYTICE